MVKRLAIVGLLLAGCGGSSGGSCPNDLPSSCPSPAPSYGQDVAPIVQARCLGCHAPGGQSANIPLDSYDALHARRSQVLDQVYACRMPPAGQPQLSSDERQKLLGWLVCGAPSN